MVLEDEVRVSSCRTVASLHTCCGGTNHMCTLTKQSQNIGLRVGRSSEEAGNRYEAVQLAVAEVGVCEGHRSASAAMASL